MLAAKDVDDHLKRSFMNFQPEGDNIIAPVGALIIPAVGADFCRLMVAEWNLCMLISDRHKIFGAVHTNGRIENRGNRFFNIATGNFLGRDNAGVTLDDVYTLTPTALLNTRIA